MGLSTKTVTSVTFPLTYTKIPALNITLMGSTSASAEIRHYGKEVSVSGFTRTTTDGTFVLHWLSCGY